jgi:prevent-host-death family protein
MTRRVTLREANQGLARVVREVEAGKDFVITRNGSPFARLAPVSGKRVLTPEQEVARVRTLARMTEGWNLADQPFDRNSLCDR